MPGPLNPSSEKCYDTRNRTRNSDGDGDGDGDRKTNGDEHNDNNYDNDGDKGNSNGHHNKPNKTNLIRGTTASSLPELNGSYDSGENANASEQDVADGEHQRDSIIVAAGATAGPGETSEASGRGESGVFLAAKRVAARKRQERAEKEARVQVIA